MTTTPPPDDAPPPSAADGAASRELLQFPVDFPIKVVGVNEDGFVHAITHLARQFDPTFDAATVELRESGGGKYLGLTITVRATSQGHLDDIYRALTGHPLTKYVL